ncbi:MAG: hypothetical protein ACW97Z_17575 [Candidatus Hodarchaeales archaeon]
MTLPHLRLEYSSNLKNKIKVNELFLQIHEKLNLIANIKPENCKSRSVYHQNFVIGNSNTNKAFIHLEIQ